MVWVAGSKTGKGCLKTGKAIRKNHNASIDTPKIVSNDMHKTEMR